MRMLRRRHPDWTSLHGFHSIAPVRLAGRADSVGDPGHDRHRLRLRCQSGSHAAATVAFDAFGAFNAALSSTGCRKYNA
jgi:hypothetical protein